MKEVFDPLVDKRLGNLTVVLPAQVGYQFLIDWSHFRSLFDIATHNQKINHCGRELWRN